MQQTKSETLKREALTASMKEESPRPEPRSAPLLSTPDYMHRIFSVQEVTFFLNLS